MSARVWPRRAAAALAAVGVVAALVLPAPEQTEAAWTDPEYAGGTFTAITVPAPTKGAECEIVGSLLNLLSSSMTLTWKIPNQSGYSLSNARINYTGATGLVPVTDTLLGSQLKTTDLGNGVYATKLTGALLGAVLGGTRELSVSMQHPSGWTSTSLKLTGTWPALALGSATCTLSPP